MFYKVANRTWKVTLWIWLSLVISFLVGLISNLLSARTTDISKTVVVNLLDWLILLGPIQLLVLSILGLFFILTLLSGLITALVNLRNRVEPLRQYLRYVIDNNQGLAPAAISQQSQALISVNVPLDTVFIHLRTVADRPIYDLPVGQQNLLEELEENIQRMRVIWSSQIGQEAQLLRQRQNANIEDVLEHLGAENPVAVPPGNPDSGKSTILRWLALQMATAYYVAVYQRWFNNISHFVSVGLCRSLSVSFINHSQLGINFQGAWLPGRSQFFCMPVILPST